MGQIYLLFHGVRWVQLGAEAGPAGNLDWYLWHPNLPCSRYGCIAAAWKLYLSNNYNPGKSLTQLIYMCFFLLASTAPIKSCLHCAKQHSIELGPLPGQRRLISWAAVSTQYFSAAPGPASHHGWSLLCTPQTAQLGQRSARSPLLGVLLWGLQEKAEACWIQSIQLLNFRQGCVWTDLCLVYICFHVMASVYFLSSIKHNYQMNSCMTIWLFSFEAYNCGSPHMHLIFSTL